MQLHLKRNFLFLVSILIVSISIPSLVSASNCCGDPRIPGQSDIKQCYSNRDPCAISWPQQTNNQGVKPCNPAFTVTNRDIDGDGTPDPYNSDCYIPIKAPSEVRITDFGKLFSGAVALLLLVAFILAFFFLILGGISWLTSGGDKAAVEAARNKIISAIIGLVIVAAVWALFQLVGGAIGFNILSGFNIPTLF